MNVELLEKIIKHVEEEPRRLQMMTWYQKTRSADSEVERAYYPPCHTAGCIAGWAVILSAKPGEEPSYSGIPRKAQELLGLDDNQAESLFYTYQWPMPFAQKYQDAIEKIEAAWDKDEGDPLAVGMMSEGIRRRMEVTVARIRYLIATGK